MTFSHHVSLIPGGYDAAADSFEQYCSGIWGMVSGLEFDDFLGR